MPKLMLARGLANGAPRVSVVIPCYNYGRFLPDCIKSVISQRSVETNILVIDDASPDGSGDIAEALAAGNPRVSVIRHKNNLGHIATYNEGLQNVNGKYVVVLSADDLLPSGALARSVALLEANTSVGLAYGHPINFSGPVPPPSREISRTWSIWPGHRWIRAQCRRGLSCIYSPEAVMRTDVQRRVGGFLDTLPHSADLELWLRIASIADVGHVNGADQAYRRVHNESMMQSSYSDVLADLKERRRAYETFFSMNEGAVLGWRSSLILSRRRLAAEALEHACALLKIGKFAESVVNSYIDFARESCEEYTKLRAWREYSLLAMQTNYRNAAQLRKHRYALERDLGGRLRFRRWRCIGV